MEPGGAVPEFWELKRMPRLLVVEDDNDVGNLLKICFTNAGMDVTVTVMGREGLALFSTELFDLVMLDVNLPDIDGFEVMRVIKSSSSQNVPIYFLTQRDERAYKLEGLGLGADDYIARTSDWVNNELTYAIGKGKKVFPLLLKGETWLAVASIQYVNVRNRKLPDESFYKTLLEALL
jgi:CheY-like chemotaxis protein